MADLAPLAVSMGEPAGIGPDLILQLYAHRAENALSPFLLFGNLEFLRNRARRLGYDFAITAADAASTAETFATALPVFHIEGLVSDNPGNASPVSSHVVIDSITRAVTETMRGACRALVTAPIHKAVLYAAGFRHPGHTEFLADLCANGGTPRLPVMMLAHEDLRVVPVTIHVPIHEVPALLTAELIAETVRITAHGLRTRYGIERPRLAIAGLNPHAGEGGAIGHEEVEVIRPAIATLQAEGIDALGPFPGDTLFYPPQWRKYDAVIAMYHDQALIPIKTIAFESAVNVTLGLPIVRTSPDHGTAFDLAGTGEGSSASFLAAMRLAHKLTEDFG